MAAKNEDERDIQTELETLWNRVSGGVDRTTDKIEKGIISALNKIGLGKLRAADVERVFKVAQSIEAHQRQMALAEIRAKSAELNTLKANLSDIIKTD